MDRMRHELVYRFDDAVGAEFHDQLLLDGRVAEYHRRRQDQTRSSREHQRVLQDGFEVLRGTSESPSDSEKHQGGDGDSVPKDPAKGTIDFGPNKPRIRGL